MPRLIDAYDQYLNDVPGCTYKTGADALRKAAQVFCEKTRVWRVKLDPYMAIEQVTDYPFDLGPDRELVRLLTAKIDGQDVPVVLPDRQAGMARGVIAKGPFMFSVFPALAAGQRIELTAAIEPSNTATTIDDELFRKHIKIIAQGAKAELFGMAKQPFSDPLAAAAARARFDEGVASTISQIAHSFSSAPLRVRGSFM
jgi:hypothetical protein